MRRTDKRRIALASLSSLALTALNTAYNSSSYNCCTCTSHRKADAGGSRLDAGVRLLFYATTHLSNDKALPALLLPLSRAEAHVCHPYGRQSHTPHPGRVLQPLLSLASWRKTPGRRALSLVTRGSRWSGQAPWSSSPTGSACQRAYMASRAGPAGVGAPVRHAATCAFTRCSVVLSASRCTRMSCWPGCVRQRPTTLLKVAPLASKPQNPC
jgi:hypothetical protein